MQNSTAGAYSYSIPIPRAPHGCVRLVRHAYNAKEKRNVSCPQQLLHTTLLPAHTLQNHYDLRLQGALLPARSICKMSE